MAGTKMRRREFVSTAALAGLAGSSAAAGRRAVSRESASRRARETLAPRPVVISSANGARPPGGDAKNGPDCCLRAMQILKGGGSPLDAVVTGVAIVEDDPTDTSVGYGGLPNEAGVVELDASCMDGATRRAGAVAAIQDIKNPAQVARTVMERSDHILLVGEGARRFALDHGFKAQDLLTDRSRQAWLRWREELSPSDARGPSPHRPAGAGKKPGPGQAATHEDPEFERWMAEILKNRPTGTINCLAVTADGDLAGVTTTSGLAWKIPGRVGDSPLIGCGVYVDNEVGAAGSTGRGEECIFINGAHTVVEMMRRGASPAEATMEAVRRVAARYGNDREALRGIQIQFYALNKQGDHAAAAMWKGARYAVNDGATSRTVDCAFLLQR